ncbi:MAG: flavodoxin [Thermoplasmata archaeon]
MSKTIVIYYSRTGTTRKFAEALANVFSGTTIEIKDKKNRLGVLGFLRGINDARKERTTEIEPANVDISNAELILFGTPVWAGRSSPAINTIIQNLDLKGKNVITFTTARSANVEGAYRVMDKLVAKQGGKVLDHTMIREKNIENAKNIAEEFAKKVSERIK